MEALTYSTVAVTLGLVVARPRIGATFRLTPAMAAIAGVCVLAAFGSVGLSDLAWAARLMWRPLLGIVSIMLMTGVARRMGVLDGVATFVFAGAGGSGFRLFTRVFLFGAITAAVLNNDSAVLLLTPLVIDAARKRHPHLAMPLAFAVFLSAGVAPFIVSNPMNMVVASYSGIGFNEYARAMAVPALAGACATFLGAAFLFRRDLRTRIAAVHAGKVVFGRSRMVVLVALGAVVLSYPVVSWFGGPVWIVAAGGALLLLTIGWAMGHRPTKIAREEVHLDTLLFLFAALILSVGLRHVGVVDRLATLYVDASPARIGVVSALGSAVLNNHPMSHLNMFALNELAVDRLPEGGHRSVFAALIGGDLGPRLFPMGSLAGLLWLEMLRRSGVEVNIKRFLVIGAVATVPALAVCLALI